MEIANVYEVLQMVIQMEEEGNQFYLEHSEKAEGDAKAIFLKLAKDEVEHVTFFTKLYNDIKNQPEYKFFYEDEAVAYFNNHIKSIMHREIKSLNTSKEVVEEGIVTEKKTIQFYEQLLLHAKPQTALMLQTIIDEEVKHVRILLKLLDTM